MSNHLPEVFMQAQSRPHPHPVRRDSSAWQLPVRLSSAPKMLACIALSAALVIPHAARAQSEVSALSTLSALPVASVVAGASATAAMVATVPLALSAGGAVLIVQAVESTARGTVYLLERASDGARASVEVAAHASGAASLAVGSSVVVSVVGAGVILSAAGQAIAFLPNALGRALLHHEQVTY